MKYRRGYGRRLSLGRFRAITTRKAARSCGHHFIDISERKQSEEALRESEERFAKAFAASPDSLAIVRLSDGVIS